MKFHAVVLAAVMTTCTESKLHRQRKRRGAGGHHGGRLRRNDSHQAEYIFKVHKHALVDNETGLKMKKTSFINFDKDDRHLMAALSEAGGRRYEHLKSIFDFLFQSHNVTEHSITDFWGYGCWCIAHGEDPRLAKRGLPADDIDAVCKNHALCYDCARIDYTHKCDPTQVGYSILGGSDLMTGEKYLECDNPDDVCKQTLCECDKMLVEGLISEYEKYDTKYHIQTSGFDGKNDCELPEPKHDWGDMDQCCGDYPMRQPFRSDNGNRQCCVDKTYHTYYLECCDGEVTNKGFCPNNEEPTTTITPTLKPDETTTTVY
jgi:hypothetical protein